MRFRIRTYALFALAATAASCGGGGGGPSSGPITGSVPQLAGAGTHPALGLVSAAPGADRLAVRWRAVDLPGGAPAAALFVGTDAATLLGTTPTAITPSAGAAVATGLAADTLHFATLAFSDGSGGWIAAGPTLRARTGTPVHVLAGASAAGADGASPATAFPTVSAGVAAAVLQGGGNLWVSGAFDADRIDVPAGVDLYGGFDGAFDLAARDPAVAASELRGTSAASVLQLQRADGSVAVVDGFVVDGRGAAEACVEVDQRSCELRSLAVGRAARGFKLRSGDLADATEVDMVRCAASSCAAGGTSIAGPLDLFMEDCAMNDNGAEGLTADDLTGVPTDTARIDARDCVFNGNGSEGFDVDLAAAPVAGTGRWVISLEDCEFVGNALDGCLVDCDYEGQPGWFSRIEILGCVARDNGRAGYHLDIDAQATSLLHRCVASANRADGLLVSSETASGTVTTTASSYVGNGTFGVRTEMGNVGVVVSHCVLAANGSGGIETGVAPALATSSIAYQQTAPWAATEEHFGLVTSAVAPGPFVQAPRAWYRVTASGTGGLTLASTPGFGVGSVVELADDGVLRTATAAGSGPVTVSPAPGAVAVPTVLAWFDGALVDEDWAPAGGSAMIGAGMAPSGGAAVDVGPLGAGAGGDPGRLDLVPAEPFWFAETSPSWSRPVAAGDTLTLVFEGGTLDSGTVAAAVSASDSGGSPIAVNVALVGNTLSVTRSGGTWASGDRIEVHDTLGASDGRTLVASVAIPLTVQ